jgi:tellurite resistance protein TerC
MDQEYDVMDVPVWIWAATIAGILALLVFDFFAHVRTPHEPPMKEAGGWSIFYVAIALVFGAGL